MSVMNKNPLSSKQGRRQFFSEILPTCSLLCLGCSSLLSCSRPEEKPAVPEERPAIPKAQHKFLENSGMSFQQVFDFTYKEFFVPLMRNIANEIGKERFTEALGKASSEFGEQIGQNQAQTLGRNDIASWAAFVKEYHLYNNALTFEIIEETDIAFEIRVTECLWAKTFREADASDVGYAVICHPDYAFAPAFNPEMKMIRTKTLMQGDGCCNHRWVIEA